MFSNERRRLFLAPPLSSVIIRYSPLSSVKKGMRGKTLFAKNVFPRIQFIKKSFTSRQSLPPQPMHLSAKQRQQHNCVPVYR